MLVQDLHPKMQFLILSLRHERRQRPPPSAPPRQSPLEPPCLLTPDTGSAPWAYSALLSSLHMLNVGAEDAAQWTVSKIPALQALNYIKARFRCMWSRGGAPEAHWPASLWNSLQVSNPVSLIEREREQLRKSPKVQLQAPHAHVHINKRSCKHARSLTYIYITLTFSIGLSGRAFS